MNIFTINSRTEVGIGGTFVDSAIKSDSRFFFPEIGVVKSTKFAKLDSELVGISNSRLYLINIHLSVYVVLAEYHYSFALDKKPAGCIFLKNREIAFTDGITAKTWEISVGDWLDFEISADLNREEKALCAYSEFANGPNFREEGLLYVNLFQSG